MTVTLCTQTASAASDAHRLDIVLRELGPIVDRLAEAGLEAGGLAGLTDWSATAARAFHDAAEAWAVDVRALEGVATDLCADVWIARQRAAAAIGPLCR